jgi:hypothetical protein
VWLRTANVFRDAQIAASRNARPPEIPNRMALEDEKENVGEAAQTN